MEIVLIVAIVAVGAAGLYVAATFNRRTKRSTAPLIDDAISDISGHIDRTAAELTRRLDAIAADLQRDREQARLDDRKIQGRLDHADSRISNIAGQLDTIGRLAEQIGAPQHQPADISPAPTPAQPSTSLPRRPVAAWERSTRPAPTEPGHPDWPSAPGLPGVLCKVRVMQ